MLKINFNTSQCFLLWIIVGIHVPIHVCATMHKHQDFSADCTASLLSQFGYYPVLLLFFHFLSTTDMHKDGFEVLINNCEMIKSILCAQKKMTYLSYQEGNVQIVAGDLKYYLLSDHQKSAES